MKKMVRVLPGIAIYLLLCLVSGNVSCADMEQGEKKTTVYFPVTVLGNPGFETGALAGRTNAPMWGGTRVKPAASYGLDTDDAHSGKASYKISCQNAEGWHYLTGEDIGAWQIIPGADYRLRVWMKGEEISSGTAWAKIIWRKEDGGNIGGGVSINVRAAGQSFDWREFVSQTARIPAEARSYIIQIGVGPKFAGTVRFDDITLEVEHEQSLDFPEAKKGLVAHWNFDEGEGEILRDLSGYGNHGKISNPIWQEGIAGKALLFSKDTRVKVPHDSVFIFRDGEFSLEAWVKPIEKRGHNVILFKGTNINLPCEYYFGTLNNDVRLLGGDMGHHCIRVALDENKWNHLVVSGDGKVVKVYHNARFYGVCAYSHLLFSRSPLWIGFEPGYKTFYNGLIDELKIYNRALSREEVREHFEQFAVQSPNGGK
ncbi:MAG: LamG domain-containing protein [bacterium]